jgi:hypothetical protein
VAGSCEYGDEPSGSGATELAGWLPLTRRVWPIRHTYTADIGVLYSSGIPHFLFAYPQI